MARRPRVLAIVLAGGEGKRLMPLTTDRAKPAVPFGGSYRLIDFVLSNLVHAGYLRICVLTQYKSHSLDRHISITWRQSSLLGNYVTPVPAQQRLGKRWFQGSADAIHQSLNLIHDDQPDYVVVFGADHVYRMDPSQLVEAHIESGAGVTVAGIRVARDSASSFGIISTSDGTTIDAFLEKPADPPPLPDDAGRSFASMGNYVFSTGVLLDALRTDAADENSGHDMGGDIVPMLVGSGAACVYDFADNDVPGTTELDRHYWRDVGTLDAYHEAHMDLVSARPVFDLHDREWPILTNHPQLPGAKFVEGGHAADSIIANGCVIAGGTAERSVLSPGVTVRDGAHLQRSIVMADARIGAGAIVRDAILDKGVDVPAGAVIGADHEHDTARGFTVSPAGVTVLGKGQYVPPP
ncbi:glucose-1-phosphate adenylyltransferase [Haloechinothrix sp. YIM 98757]|uniref:Glucose-1-phosphate adenylyltransferase n=1 Tax=Haloechinothrix aidingensis TaxID=2752311 RepID=A0A838A973_9PSEU|nr:glucose-1-phosphate adenylyltransferase [Haloechinothrix aidingensis]MBA0125139.1 glucose-1-phosphate adenylyltransferase [Haloechinothrix aidingensis]